MTGTWSRIADGKVLILLSATAASFVLAVGVTQAQAVVVDAAPTWPVPTDAPAAPPPIPDLPTASDDPPPTEQIADPVTTGAACSGWYLQSNYGNRWPASSAWWEYRCTYGDPQYYPHPCPEIGACDAVCYGYPWDCYWVSQDRVDYFYWNGSEGVFYGQSYASSVYDEAEVYGYSAAWWDGPTAHWYVLGPHALIVSKAGNGSGAVYSSPNGIDCGDTCQTSFGDGQAVTLTAIPDAFSVFTGWSGDCSGTGACQLTMDQAHAVTATFARKRFDLSVSKQGTGSGEVSSSPAGINCGDSCQASFDAGTAVTLTAAPAAGSIFTGWSGDCSGTGSCQLTGDQGRSVTATFALNTPPHASFTVACTGLSCSFDGTGSADSDGTIQAYSWEFGDGATGSGKTVSHTYARPGSYTVSLTVTDNAGASGNVSKVVSPIVLTAQGYKLKGLENVDLYWSGPTDASFDVYRNGTRVATVAASAYTDNINNRGSASYAYTVCGAGFSSCSEEVTVTF
jgi:PKD repeat protein